MKKMEGEKKIRNLKFNNSESALNKVLSKSASSAIEMQAFLVPIVKSFADKYHNNICKFNVGGDPQ